MVIKPGAAANRKQGPGEVLASAGLFLSASGLLVLSGPAPLCASLRLKDSESPVRVLTNEYE